MININDPLTSKNRIREAGAGIHKIARSDFGRRRRPQGEAQDAPSQIFSPRPVIPFPDQLFTVLSGPHVEALRAFDFVSRRPHTIISTNG
jgi:hypothetical protein